MPLPTYREVADKLEIPVCSGRTDAGFTCYAGNHKTGVVADGKVHWSSRVMTREGLKRFLMLDARRRYPLGSEPAWVKLWVYLRAVWTMAEEVGVRFPPRLRAFDKEKAHMRAMLVKVPTDTPGRKEALIWATRK